MDYCYQQDYCKKEILRKCINQENVHPDDRRFAKNFICSTCIALIYQPCTCETCKQSVGKACLDVWQTGGNTKCPISGCLRFVKMPINDPVRMSVLNDIRLTCEYPKCKEVLSHDNFYDHLSSCQYRPYVCKATNCDFEGNKEQIEEHVRFKCEKLTRECPHCRKKITVKLYQNHHLMCENQPENCKACGNIVRRCEMSNHLKYQCDYVQVVCEMCMESFTKKALVIHEKNKSECRTIIEKKAINKVKGELELEALKTCREKLKEIKSEYVNIGIILKKMGRYTEACESYRKAIDIDPNDKEVYRIYGIALSALGKYSDACESYKKAITIDPNFKEAHNNLGNSLRNLGRNEEACDSYNKAIAIDPSFKKAHNNLGNALRELGKFQDACESCKRAIAIDPNFKEAYNNLGVALKDLGKDQEACESYHKAIAIDPSFKTAQNNLKIILEKKESSKKLPNMP